MSSILLLFIILPVITACPSGWVQDGSLCYFFSRVTGSWAEASSYCSAFGALLAEPMSSREMSFLSNQVQKLKSTASEYYLGGSDMFVDGEWIWASSSIDITQNKWQPGEPNNVGQPEDCLALLHSNGNWNDVPCNTKLPFVCQTEATDGGIVGK